LAPLAGCGSHSSSDGDSGTTDAKAPNVTAPTNLLKAGTLKLGASLTYPPLGYLDSSGKQAGLDPELSTLVAEQFDLKKEMTNQKFATLIPSLQAHQVDALFTSIFITKERAAAVDFVPYFETGQAFVVKSGSSYQPQTADDLCGKTVSVLQGSVTDELVSGEIGDACKSSGNPLTVKEFSTDPEATQEVVSGRADVWFTDRSVAVFQTGSSLKGKLTVSSNQILYPVAVGIAVRKGDTEMKNAFQAAIDALDESGQLQRELDKFGLSPVTDEVLSQSLAS
jgi:ABC-type amino acid transport substrate-binding protein